MRNRILLIILLIDLQLIGQTQFFGMTSKGGQYNAGTIFKTNNTGSNQTIDYSFPMTEGVSPWGHMIQASDGKLYGLACSGGKNTHGVLFQYDPVTNNYAKKVDFEGVTKGRAPYGALMQASDGMLYGLTCDGGLNNKGVLFQYDPVTNVYIKKIDFSGTINGANPKGSLIEAPDGNFYGLTQLGGANNKGVLFQYNPSTNMLIKKHDFDGAATGSNPMGSLIIESNGDLLGLSYEGGAFNSGVIFKYDYNNSICTKLYDFSTVSGKNPKGSLIQAANGKIYGLTYNGGLYNAGVIFQYDLLTNLFIKKLDFNNLSTGSFPAGDLVEATNGMLYGGAEQGGANNKGVFFQYDYTLDSFVKLVEFSGIDGSQPSTSVVQASDGNIYATTIGGGIGNAGVLFQYNPNTHIYTKKNDFRFAINGADPLGSLVMASDGNLYGMTSVGGAYDLGTFFQYNPITHTCIKKVDFDPSTGAKPRSQNLIEATNGKLYGLTYSGGSYVKGVLFEYDLTTSTYTKKFEFNGSDGAYPVGSLVQASDGMLYGVTLGGGADNLGVLFQYNPLTGSYNKKIEFQGILGPIAAAQPLGSLMQASDGKIYGMAGGGANGMGIIYQYDPVTGTYTNKFSFSAINGKNPQGVLVEASNNTLYGMTLRGGLYDNGTLFQFDPASNNFIKRFDFRDTLNGRGPYGSLIQATDGKLYGMVTSGGANQNGTLFQYDINLNNHLTKLDFLAEINGSIPCGDLVEVSSMHAIVTQSLNNSNCVSDSFQVAYSVSGAFASGNVFTAQLSDVTGSFLSAVSIGTLSSLVSGTIDVVIPSTTIYGNAYRIRVISSYPFITGSDNGNNITINVLPNITVNSGSICSGQSFTMNPSGTLSYTYSSGSATVSPAVSATYTVTGSNANGCTANAISSVTVNPTPTITVNSGTICSGETFTITPAGAATYTYSSGSNTVSPTTNSTYTITGTDVNGCISATGAVSTLSVNTAPSLTATSNASVCVGTSTVLNVSGANTYSWDTGATTTSISVSPTITTTYTVTGTNLNNCSATQTVTVTVNPNCQDVWPGDANSDGLVDNTDVLELGVHFTQTGPARATVSNAWQSYYATNWTGTITNGKNVNHSDCNGDGTIDANDTLAIFNNYGLTHAFRPAESTIVNPQLSIVPDQNVVAKGNWGSASMFLGEASAPISNINGLAFTVTFDQSVIDANSFYIEYPASFLNAGNQNLKFQKSDFSNGKLYTATTHTNNVNASGYGKIAVLHYKIKSGLTRDEVLNIGITQTKQSNASGVLTPITAGTATVAAIGASVGIDELSNGNNIGLYPNPATISAIIQSSSLLQKVEVLSLTGQIILSETTSGTQHQLDLSSVANGVYFVNIYSTDQKVSRKKLVVQR